MHELLNSLCFPVAFEADRESPGGNKKLTRRRICWSMNQLWLSGPTSSRQTCTNVELQLRQGLTDTKEVALHLSVSNRSPGRPRNGEIAFQGQS